MNETRRPLIVNINQNSLDDGPGIRSVIFFKGCPLRCVWCQNPEAQNLHQELIFQKNLCIHCEPCRVNCPIQAFRIDSKEKQLFLNRQLCNHCFDCTSQCPTDVFKIAGKYYEIAELVEIIKDNLVFYKNSGGGLTLSGGEPLIFPEFIEQLVQEVRKLGVNICIETAGLFNLSENITKIFQMVDLIYFDIKIYNSIDHKRYCGVDNSIILQNFEKLIYDLKFDLPETKDALNFKNLNELASYHNKTPILIPRIPLIPEITDTPENLMNIRQFFQSHRIKLIDLMPYNPLWLDKCDTIGIDKKYFYNKWMSKSELASIRELFKDFLLEKF